MEKSSKIKGAILFITPIVFILPLNVYAGRGCCSWHGGQNYCDTKTGRWVCNDGTYSPSCTCEIAKVYGCTDQNATNYNSGANQDDGSCVYKVMGCTDASATNYNAQANTADGSCLYEKTVEEQEAIPYSIKIVEKSQNINATSGKDGVKKVTKKVIVNENGTEQSSEIIGEEIIEEPVEKIIVEKENKEEKKNNSQGDKDENNSSPIIPGILMTGLVASGIFYKKNKDKN